MISVGTCGFSYKDWVGPVYPAGTKPAEMLPLYANMFSVVEIDSTYYGVPARATVEAWARRTPPGFRFSAKLPGTGTHVPQAALGLVHDDVALFRAALEPLVAAGKFVCALMQFPNSFRPSDATLEHVRALREALRDIPLVAEFRHREWQSGATLDLSRRRRAAVRVAAASIDGCDLRHRIRALSRPKLRTVVERRQRDALRLSL
jgi:uncharacterized protein YecE (DUF72 family)